MADKPFIISKDLQVGDGSAAGTTDALLRVDDTNNRVGINTPTPTGTLDVTVASSSDRGLIVRSVSSQTTRSFEILGANGSGVFSIDPSGSVYFSPWSGTQTSSIRYDAPTNGLVFTGSGTSANPIELNVLSDSTLSFEGTAGQLFSVADGLSSGTIFAVSDISGMPSLEIDASGLIKLGEFDGFVGVGTSQTYGQYSGKMEINYPSGYKGLLVRPGSAEIRNALEVQNSSSGTVFSVDPYGATVIDLTTSTTSKGLIIQAATSQAVNLQEWQNASSTVLASVNQEGRFSGVSYNASSGVILQSATPSSTTNTLYNVGGSLYFNGSAVGGSISTLTFGSGLSGSTSSTFDGTSAVTVNLGGTGTLSQLGFTGDHINIGNDGSNYSNTAYSYINIGLSAGDSASGNISDINIGQGAGQYSKFSEFSIALGYSANVYASGVYDSIAIGSYAGSDSKDISNSINIGYYAGTYTNGNYNTYIGYFAGHSASGNNNIEIKNTGYTSLLSGSNSNKINLGSVIVGDTSSKRLAIGDVSSSNLSPNSTIEILPSGASTKSLILKGTVAYATNFLEVQNSSSTANLYIDQNYNLVTTGNVVANSGAFNVLDLTPIPDTSYPTWQEGLVFYDDDNKALTLYNDVSDVSQQLGQEFYIRAKNVSVSGTIYNGQVVHIEGANGQHPTIELAFAGDEEASRVIGVATHDILYNDFGYVTMLGTVRGVNTDGYSAGDRLFLSSSVSGAFTSGIPTYPNYNTRIGYVITPHSSNGSILVVPYAPRKAGTQVVAPASDGRSSGVAFFSTDDLLVTDSDFYYDSGNNKLVVPTGQVGEIRSSDTNIRFLGSGTTALPSTLARSVIVGWNSLPGPRLATDSVYLGTYAGSYTSGIGNIAIGILAGAGNTFGGDSGSGNYNIYMGYAAGSANNGNNNFVLNPTNTAPLHYGVATSYSNIIEIAQTIVGSSSTKRLAIGNVSSSNFSPNAVLEVLPSTTTTKGVIVKSYAGQAANLQEWQNSSSSGMLFISPSGRLGINTYTSTDAMIHAASNISGVPAARFVRNGSATNALEIYQGGTKTISFGDGNYGNNYIGTIYQPYQYAGLLFQEATSGYTSRAYMTALDWSGGLVYKFEKGYISTYNSTLGFNGASAGILGAFNFGIGTYCAGGAGYSASPTSSNNNFFFGDRCFGGGFPASNNTVAISNFMFGYYSAQATTGNVYHNCFIGANSLSSLRYGNYNISLGQGGMGTFEAGDYNIAIGQGTIFPATGSYSIAIGRGATVDKNNQLVIGSTSYKIGRSSAGESGVSSTSPSGISHLLEAKINGAYYQIPLLPSGATDLQKFSALSVSGGIEITSGIPSSTTNKLYASGSTLYFNGTQVGAGGGLTGGSSGYIPIWDSASSLTYDSSLAYSTSGKYFTYTGTGVSANPMKMKILDDSTLSFESTDGQLFSISDGLQSGRIFAVNDISGMPFIEVDASGLVKIAEYDGVLGIGTSQTYGQYSSKVEITYPSGLGGLISRPASGAPGNALEVQTFSSGTVFTVSQSGTISSTLQGQTAKGLVVKAGTSQTANLIELQDAGGTPILTISPSGSISGAIAPGIITTSSSPYSLTDAHHGKIVEYTGTSSGTFNIGTITIPGWNCMLVNLESGILVNPNGNTLYSPGNASGTRTKYSSVSLYYRGSNTFVLGGDLA